MYFLALACSIMMLLACVGLKLFRKRHLNAEICGNHLGNLLRTTDEEVAYQARRF